MKRMLASLAAGRRQRRFHAFSQAQLDAWAAAGLYPIGGGTGGVVLLPLEEPIDAATSTEVPGAESQSPAASCPAG